jgi:hypothetical protein
VRDVREQDGQRGDQAAESADQAHAEPEAQAGSLQARSQRRARHADDYHAQRPSEVAEFNRLTGGECAGGPAGVAWGSVRAWQQTHWQVNNLIADGLIDEKTLAAARQLAGHGRKADGAKAPVAETPAADAGGDLKVQEPKAQPARADTATLEQFQQELHAIGKLLAGWRPPKWNGPQQHIAMARADGQKVKDTTTEAKPQGAMMAHLDQYRSTVEKMVPLWSGLSAEDRTKALMGALNEVLASEKVSPVQIWSLVPMPGAGGRFNSRNWTIFLSQEIFGNASLAPAQIKAAASDLFHEGRHAEQRFATARLLASKGQPVAQIAASVNIEASIAQQAVAVAHEHPLDPAQAAQAELFYKDTVEHKSEHQATEILAREVAVAGPKARTVFDALSPDVQAVVRATWQDYRSRMYEVIDAYENLPVEKDARAAELPLGFSR